MNCNEHLENTKMTLYNAEHVEDIKNNPVVKATILSLLKAVPVIGELLDGTIDAALTRFQESKRTELLDIILSDSENITTEMVNDVEFIINFAKTLEAVNKLATNDKVEYFALLLKKGYLSESKIENSLFEECLFALSTLSYRQINILIELYLFEKMYVDGYVIKEESQKGNELKPRSENWDKLVNTIQDKYGIDREELRGILYSISKTGFCREITGMYFDYSGGIFAVTEYCKRFMKMITGEIDE